MAARYIFHHKPSTSSGSAPMSTCLRPLAMACEAGASMAALTTSGAESTSPTPTMPASVWMRTIRSSWLPSAMPSSSAGWRKMMASTSVIFTPFGAPVLQHAVLRVDVAEKTALLQLRARVVLAPDFVERLRHRLFRHLLWDDGHAVEVGEDDIAAADGHTRALDGHVVVDHDAATPRVDRAHAAGEHGKAHLHDASHVADVAVHHCPARAADFRGGRQELTPQTCTGRAIGTADRHLARQQRVNERDLLVIRIVADVVQVDAQHGARAADEPHVGMDGPNEALH